MILNKKELHDGLTLYRVKFLAGLDGPAIRELISKPMGSVVKGVEFKITTRQGQKLKDLEERAEED